MSGTSDGADDVGSVTYVSGRRRSLCQRSAPWETMDVDALVARLMLAVGGLSAGGAAILLHSVGGLLGAAPVAVSSGVTATTPWVSLTAGAGPTCGLTPSGTAYCWGDNGSGQLGDGSGTNHATPVAVAGGLAFVSLSAGTDHTCGVTERGVAYCWG